MIHSSKFTFLLLTIYFSLVSFIINPEDTTSYNSANINIIDQNLEIIKKNMVFENDSILNLAKQILKLSENTAYTNGVNLSNFYIANIYRIRNINDSAIYFYEKGVESISEKNKLKTDFYWNLANLYRITGNYSLSLESALNAKEIVESQDLSVYKYSIYNLLALSYQSLMEYDLAKKYYDKSASLALLDSNEAYAGIIYANIGKLFFDQDSLDKAFEFLDKGVRLEEKYELYGNAGNSYTILARIYMKKNMLDSTIKYLLKARNFNKISNNQIGLTYTLYSVSEYYFLTKEYDNALLHLKITIDYATKFNFKNTLSQAYYLKAQIYAEQNDFKKAYNNFESFFDIYSELYDVEKINKAKALEQKLIQQGKENMLFELEIEKQETVSNLIIAIASLILIAGIVIMVYLFRYKKLNKKHIRSKEKAEESDKLKSQFLQTISHEIRTPLNGIIGFSEMISSKSLSDSELIQINDHIIKNSDDLISTIENLVDIAHLSTNQYNVQKSKFELSKVLENIFIKAEDNVIYKNKKDIKLELKKNVSLEIYSDKSIVTKILQHLVKNAILFTNKGSIQLGYNIEKSNVIVFVKDTGIGISQEKIDIIFSPFRNAEENINIKVGGTGLGLTIVNGFIQILGGKVWVGSELKKGTTFYVSLPIN